MQYTITKVEEQRQPGGESQAFCYLTWALDNGLVVNDVFPVEKDVTQEGLDTFIKDRAVTYIDAEFSQPAPDALILEPSLTPVDVDIDDLKRKFIEKR